jgi:hypothetical protein
MDTTTNNPREPTEEEIEEKEDGRAPEDVTERMLLQTEIDLTGTTGQFRVFQEES